MVEKCAAITRGGRPCPSPPLAGSAWCWTHDPNAAGARVEASRKGGRARSNAERAKKQIPAAMGADELAGWLSVLFKGVVGGRIEPKVGTAAATIARALLEVRNQTEIEERLAALEQAAGIDGRRSA